MTEIETLFCAYHSGRETLLRCNKCEQPICIECAVQTPTGYRCKSCVRGQQKKFNTSQFSDFVIAPIVAGILSFIGSYFVNFLGFFTLLATPFFGMIIERTVRVVIKNRRSNSLFITTAIGCAIGSFPLLILDLLSIVAILNHVGFNVYTLLPMIWQGAYSILITGAIYYRLKGISF